MMFTKKEARKYVEWFKETLEEQPTADPCIYLHEGKIDFSPGNVIGGTAQAVYNGEAEILVNAEQWRSWNDSGDFDNNDLADLMYQTVVDFLED